MRGGASRLPKVPDRRRFGLEEGLSGECRLILRLCEGFHCSREVRLDHNQYFLARAEHYGPPGIGPAMPVNGTANPGQARVLGHLRNVALSSRQHFGFMDFVMGMVRFGRGFAIALLSIGLFPGIARAGFFDFLFPQFQAPTARPIEPRPGYRIFGAGPGL
jgi:hypothetical protein